METAPLRTLATAALLCQPLVRVTSLLRDSPPRADTWGAGHTPRLNAARGVSRAGAIELKERRGTQRRSSRSMVKGVFSAAGAR